MIISSNRLFQVFKYAVYALLAMNIYWFFREEHAAAALQFADGLALADVIEAYSATIDTAAWVVLLLMFELETHVLEDRHFTPLVTRALHGLRIICYAFIAYAFYGYVQNLLFVSGTEPLAGVRDLCSLVSGDWSWTTTLDEYATITAANCGDWSTAVDFVRFSGMQAVVDAPGLTDIVRLAWVDVINSAVWLLVVLVLEIDVRLQERNRYEGIALHASTAAKSVLYFLLLLAAIYWGIKGDFVDFWDAFLWLVAFVFIELNVFEWRAEEHAVRSVAAERDIRDQDT
ncbi:MAG: hypothetical protein KJO56_11795 [Gammaproteobacteria bacterium]|nr:hypothetical protein [Gammaproteobacteria bacterium]NNL63044.1 hypothetical protein [Woeseiaceae bacterium]